MALKLVKLSKTESREALGKARDHLIESAGKISANMLGMVSKVGGQIYALLFLSREPLSLDQIADSLKISKGNISVNVRLLEEVGLVSKVWVKGDRKDYYQVCRNYPRKLLRGFFDRVRGGIEDSLRVIHRCQSEVEELDRILEGQDLEAAQFVHTQLGRLSAFYQAASQLFEDFYQGRDVDTDMLRKAIWE